MHPYIPELKDAYQKKKISRRQFLRHAAMLGLSLGAANSFLAACAGPEETPQADPTATPAPQASPTPLAATAEPVGGIERGGVLRWERGWLSYIADPAQDGKGTGEAGRLIAETLTWVDADNVAHPLLAERWEVSEDAKEWTLHLQQGVTFNNGKEFGADDVVWNFEHWLDEDTGSPMASRLSYLSSSGVEKVDDHTVKLWLDQPSLGLPYVLYDFPALIMPEGGADDFYHGDAEHAVGTGPFLMKEFIPDERLEAVRRDDYWQNGIDGQPLPYLDGVVAMAGFEHDASRVAALIGNEIDVVSPGDAAMGQLEGREGIVVEAVPTPWSSPARVRCDLEPFDDPRVRNALKLCQDRERIRDLVMPRGGIAYDHWVSPLHEGYCPGTDGSRPRDIERAKQLLTEAGYPDGIRVTLVSPTSPDHRPALAQVLKEMAAPAGIDIDIEVLPDSAFWDQWMDYPFSISGWNGRRLPTDNLSLGARCGAAWNEMHWCNEEFDATLTKAEATVDIEERRALFCDLQRLMQEDSGLLLPFWNVATAAYRTEVRGYQKDPFQNYYFLYTWLA